MPVSTGEKKMKIGVIILLPDKAKLKNKSSKLDKKGQYEAKGKREREKPRIKLLTREN